jgi:hypothetical protein
MQKIVTVVHWFNLLAALFLTATMMFEFVDVPWGLLPQFLFFSSYIVEFFLDKKWKRVTLNKTHLYFLVMFGFFGLALVYYPFDSTTYFRVLLERRYALAGFAFVGFFGVNDKYKLSYFLNLFVVTSLLIIAYLLVVRIGLPDFFESDQKIRLFNRTRTAYVNQHMGFNLFLDLALVSIWYLFKSSWRLMPIWKRVVYFLSAGIFLSCLLISEGRAGFLITIVLVCVIIGLQFGASYKVNDWLSVFGGGRMNYFTGGYEGFLNANLKQVGTELVAIELDCDQTGWGLTPIIGADVKLGKWNIGLKYEFMTSLNLENKTRKAEVRQSGTALAMDENNPLAAYRDGVNTPSDIPALLTAAVGYEILPTLRASVEYHFFLCNQDELI